MSVNVEVSQDRASVEYVVAAAAGEDGLLTRSSPIGPALHDEGGSLWYCQYIARVRGGVACDGVVVSRVAYRPRSVSSCWMVSQRLGARGAVATVVCIPC